MPGSSDGGADALGRYSFRVERDTPADTRQVLPWTTRSSLAGQPAIDCGAIAMRETELTRGVTAQPRSSSSDKVPLSAGTDMERGSDGVAAALPVVISATGVAYPSCAGIASTAIAATRRRY